MYFDKTAILFWRTYRSHSSNRAYSIRSNNFMQLLGKTNIRKLAFESCLHVIRKQFSNS